MQVWRKKAQKRARYDWVKYRYPVDFMVKEVTNGMMKEGRLNGELDTAKFLCQPILDLRFGDWDGLCACIIKLYTKQTFLFGVLNKALREKDMSKMASLGPLC